MRFIKSAETLKNYFYFYDQLTGMENAEFEIKETALKIASNQNTELDKEHLQFNKLCKSIEKLQREIDALQNQYERLMDYYLLHCRPGFVQFSEIQFEFIELLDKRYKEIKLSKRQLAILSFAISEIFNMAIELVEPNEHQIAIFDHWNPEYRYKMRVGDMKDEIKEELSDFIWDAFGLEMDPDEMDDSEESLKNLEKKLKDFIEQQKNGKSSSKKSSKENTTFELNNVKAELQDKSIRKIYLSLAKILHPDVNLNEEEKRNREQIMKQVNQAYEKRDLYSLLKIEMEWMNNNTKSQTDKNTLELYILVLKDQIKELRQKKQFIKMDPRWFEINDLLHIPEKTAIYKMDYNKEMQDKKIRESEIEMRELKNSNNPRHFIVAMIKGYELAYDQELKYGIW